MTLTPKLAALLDRATWREPAELAELRAADYAARLRRYAAPDARRPRTLDAEDAGMFAARLVDHAATPRARRDAPRGVNRHRRRAAAPVIR